MKIVCWVLFCVSWVLGSAIDFSLIQKGESSAKMTLLVMGGIQGDEPGGFHAANLLATPHYKITQGSVWVVPNLNPHSILANHRGIYGDMNRKFAQLSPKDPEYETIQRIKSIILDSRVGVILHLHDGSGFYREEYLGPMFNPKRWGQSSIIDQERIETAPHGALGEIGGELVAHINRYILEELHRYRLKNTHTAQGDKEMEKALTYFAIQHQKAALANEASKSLKLEERVYYHLLAIEGMMNYLQISFERDFELNPSAIKRVLEDPKIEVHFENRISLPLHRLRPLLSYFPTPKEGLKGESSNALVRVIKERQGHGIWYGNRRISTLLPDFFESDESLPWVKLQIDGEEKRLKMGECTEVRERFLVHDLPLGCRANVIGYVNAQKSNETELEITQGEIEGRFSLDQEERLYRVEFYCGDRFSGMMLVDFVKK
ncbi:M14 family metallopeptidase [Wolinella succinogenes]|uniref:M14 family metallopeptidase n=1 Tax=Wolinella succinogenes TaxID=844 RepID=UPI002356C127|nr:M14 family metallopeptidase [Wolinella succinogenes]